MIYSHIVPEKYRQKKTFFTWVMLFFFIGSPLAACNRVDLEMPLFPDVKPWDIKSIKITDKDNKELFFKRKNCVWTLGQKGIAINEVKAANLADQIIGISYQQTIPGDTARYAEYKVGKDTFNYRVEIGLPEGKVKTLFLGFIGDSDVTHARIDSNENVFALSGTTHINNIPMEVEPWLPVSDI